MMIQFRKMFSLCYFVPRFLLLFILLGILRKFWVGQKAMDFVRKCSADVAFNKLIANSNINSSLSMFSANEKPILIMFLNEHIIQMTLNWLCNTRQMEDVHERLLLITMDPIADQELGRLWPNVRRLNLDLPCLRCPFRYGDGPYQLFFVLRANIARILAEMGQSFWMIQQDTFWRQNLLQIGIEHKKDYLNADILFDRANQNGLLIAGGYFYSRSTKGSKEFFRKLADDLMEKYIPDNVWMSRMCAIEWETTKCGFIPFKMITNWQWIYEDKKNDSFPALIQFDGETQNGGKLAKMHSLGFYFLDENGQKCKFSAIEDANQMMDKIGWSNSSINSHNYPSYSQWQFSIYQAFIQQFYKYSATGWLLNHFIYPNAHFFMLTI